MAPLVGSAPSRISYTQGLTMRNGKLVLAEVGVGPLPMAYIATLWDRPDIHLLAFEPNPTYYAEVAAAAGARPNVELYNVAIGDEPGRLSLYDEGTSSSLVGVASQFAQHHGADRGARTVEVDVRRISDFDKGDIDILRVDTEGAEWLCLKHLVSRPNQIVVEIYNDLATYINPHLYEISEWARQEGYSLQSIHDSDFIYVRA